MILTSDKEIIYQVVRSRRTTAELLGTGWKIRVPPQRLTDQRIAKLVESRRPWIYKTLAAWRDANATRILREYRNGEGFLYLGRSYRLLLASKQSEPLMLKNGRFCLRRDLVDMGGVELGNEAFREFYIARGRPNSAASELLCAQNRSLPGSVRCA